MLRKIFGPKWKELRASSRKLHDEDIRHIPLVSYHSGDRFHDNDMDRLHGSLWGVEKFKQGFCSKIRIKDTAWKT
jgi:hypothetical protein